MIGRLNGRGTQSSFCAERPHGTCRWSQFSKRKNVANSHAISYLNAPDLKWPLFSCGPLFQVDESCRCEYEPSEWANPRLAKCDFVPPPSLTLTLQTQVMAHKRKLHSSFRLANRQISCERLARGDPAPSRTASLPNFTYVEVAYYSFSTRTVRQDCSENVTRGVYFLASFSLLLVRLWKAPLRNSFSVNGLQCQQALPTGFPPGLPRVRMRILTTVTKILILPLMPVR